MTMPTAMETGTREHFSRRVRALPSATLVHVPVDQRERHALILAALLDRIAQGDEDACLLEEARSKLLLGPVPRGANRRVESCMVDRVQYS